MSGDGRTVLITGASRGIGRATALHLAGRGWQVVAGVRDPAAGEELCGRSPRITAVELDVTDDGQVAKLAGQLPPRVDALVNNAGIGVGGPVESVAVDEVRRQFEVNVFGQIAVTQAVLPRLRESRGRLVFVSSLNGRVAVPMSGAYNASKYAVECLADNLRVELRPWGIRVVLVEPGCIDTDPWRRMLETFDEFMGAMTPAHRELYAAHLTGERALLARLQKQARPVDLVAEAVERALTRARPRSRYLVGGDARMFVALKKALPTPVFDALLARGLGMR
ncbi:SDR family oxidoreductase [Streptomyces sp. NPDC051940]|uniref:SDR family oxidoreductase n=1 Tax=Streptomyces sp. NPDC051940 TaxID=3155675 RepID=UPI0034481775